MNSSEPKGSIRIDLRTQTWQLTSIVVCCGLASFVACVLLVVAIFVFQYKDRQCKVSRKEERLLWRHDSCFDDEEIAHVRYDTRCAPKLNRVVLVYFIMELVAYFYGYSLHP